MKRQREAEAERIIVKPCADCGAPIQLLPPEDNVLDEWLCGRCAHWSVAMVRAAE